MFRCLGSAARRQADRDKKPHSGRHDEMSTALARLKGLLAYLLPLPGTASALDSRDSAAPASDAGSPLAPAPASNDPYGKGVPDDVKEFPDTEEELRRKIKELAAVGPVEVASGRRRRLMNSRDSLSRSPSTSLYLPAPVSQHRQAFRTFAARKECGLWRPWAFPLLP